MPKQMRFFLFLLLSVGLILPAAADCPVKENDFGRSLLALFHADLDKDGQMETIKIIDACPFFTNSESDWAEATGLVIVIFDQNGKELFWDEAALPFQLIKEIFLDDANQDGYKEIVIAVNEDQPHPDITYRYGYQDGAFGLIAKNWDKVVAQKTPADLKEEQFWQARYLLILYSTRDYQDALKFANEASKNLVLPFKNEEKKYSAKKGIYFSESIDDEIYRGEYYPRRYFDDYISLENSSAYRGLVPGEIIVVAGVFGERTLANDALVDIKAFYPDAYVKKTVVWMGYIQ
ncbi:MAG: hypothetical protein V1727_01835 [Candidatus Omnitrophota bacterium]